MSSARAHPVVRCSDYSSSACSEPVCRNTRQTQSDHPQPSPGASHVLTVACRGLHGLTPGSWPPLPAPHPLAGSIPAPAVCQAGSPGPLHWLCPGLPSHPFTRELFALPFSPLSFPLPSSPPLPFSFFPPFLKKMFLSFYFWLCWVFTAAQAFSLAATSSGYSLIGACSLRTVAAPLVAEHGSRHTGPAAAARGPSSCGA